MVLNSHGSSNKSILVLYKVVNNEADNADHLFNAFSMPRDPKGPTLAAVKQYVRFLLFPLESNCIRN